MDARIGVETPARAAAVRATGLLESGPESSFDRLTALAATLLGTSMTYLTLADETHSVLKGAPDSAAMCGPDGRFMVPVREAACQIVVDSGVEAVVPDTAADPRLRDLLQVKRFGAAAWIGVPVCDAQGHVLGNLCAMDTRVRPWTEQEVTSLRSLAAAVGNEIQLRIAMQDLQSYAAEATELARTLQESLLPAHAPRIPGMAVATRFAPGGTGVEVLGDFYDVVPLEGGFGVVIGDVCGKGATAARTTAMARSAVRTAAHSEADPEIVLGTVNDVLLSWFGAGHSFVTATYATLHREGTRWRLQVASAGHPPGFVRRADGRVEQLRGGGRVLGLTAAHPIGREDLVLEAGDALVVYTDGITEARDPAGTQLDEEGVAAALGRAAVGTDADGLADVLVDTARAHARHANADDLAVVVLQVDRAR